MLQNMGILVSLKLRKITTLLESCARDPKRRKNSSNNINSKTYNFLLKKKLAYHSLIEDFFVILFFFRMLSICFFFKVWMGWSGGWEGDGIFLRVAFQNEGGVKEEEPRKEEIRRLQSKSLVSLVCN